MAIKVCIECSKRVAPWYRPICDYCDLKRRQFTPAAIDSFDGRFKKLVESGVCSEKFISETVNATNIATKNHAKEYSTKTTQNSIQENVKMILGILFGLFMVWMLFGGLLEKDDSHNVITVDCSGSDAKYNRYCNGEYESVSQEQDFKENNFNQNIVR